MTTKLCGAKTRQGGTCRQPAKANGRCRYHGGNSLVGTAHPSFKHGRYSKVLKLERARSYQEALNQPDLLSLYDEVALIQADIELNIERSEKGDAHPAWIEVKKTIETLFAIIEAKEMDVVRFIKTRERLEALVQPHYQAAIAYERVFRRIDQKASIADRERRMMIDTQKLVSLETARVRVMAALEEMKLSVYKHCDDRLAGQILADASAAYSRRMVDA